MHANKTIGKRRSRRAIATVEFALSAPLLLIMLAGTLDFAMLLRTAACVADAARSGAQYGEALRGAQWRGDRGQGRTGKQEHSD